MHEGALMETASVGAGAVGGVATDCYPPLSAIRSDPPFGAYRLRATWSGCRIVDEKSGVAAGRLAAISEQKAFT